MYAATPPLSGSWACTAAAVPFPSQAVASLNAKEQELEDARVAKAKAEEEAGRLRRLLAQSQRRAEALEAAVGKATKVEAAEGAGARVGAEGGREGWEEVRAMAARMAERQGGSGEGGDAGGRVAEGLAALRQKMEELLREEGRAGRDARRMELALVACEAERDTLRAAVREAEAAAAAATAAAEGARGELAVARHESKEAARAQQELGQARGR